MKNSTLLCLLFISIGLPLACATSPRKTKKDPPTLVDTTSTAPAVQPKETGVLVSIFSTKYPFYQKIQCSPEKFKKLMRQGDYETIVKIAKNMNADKFREHLCQAVTIFYQLKMLFEYLEKREMLPYFLAHGNMEVVKKVIAEKNLLKPNDSGYYDNIYDAITMSLNEDSHERAMELFQGAREKWTLKSNFSAFVRAFFESYPPWENSMPLKRFLTLQGEEFSRKHPETFEIFCQYLVQSLKSDLANPDSQKLLTDLVGQPFILTLTAFVGGFLEHARHKDCINFIEYGWREAFVQGFFQGFDKSRMFWTIMKAELPTRFSEIHSGSVQEYQTALKDFGLTKQEREESWLASHHPNEKTKEREIQLAKFLYSLDAAFPTNVLDIVAGYAILSSWIDYD